MQELLINYLKTSSPKQEVIENYNAVLVFLVSVFEKRTLILEKQIEYENMLKSFWEK